MAASTTPQPFLHLLSSNRLNHQSIPPLPMSPILLLLSTFCLLLLLLLIIITFSLLHKRLKKIEQQQQQQSSNSTTQCRPPKSDPTHLTNSDSDPTHLTRSLLLEILSPNSPEWETLLKNCENSVRDEPGLDLIPAGSDCGEKKRKKKRAKKKRPDSKPEEGGGLGEKEEEEGLVCLYPFTTSSSATQRRIKQQYDQLVKCHESHGLTMAQVGQFVNCLIEAKNELQHKSDTIQRKFTITKALLFKADRSSFDRLRQQIYKLELEQKRLEEDAFVYNWLQKQLKLSPAYKKMLEIGACMELQAKSGELTESADSEFEDTISFEELLAQEKKDSFWQKNGKPRTCSG